MAVNFRMGRRGAPLSRLNAQPRSRVTVWKPLNSTKPVILNLSAGNTLDPASIVERPEWFVNANFTLVLEFVTITFTWNGTEWTTSGEFPSEGGTGTLIQGANSNTAHYSNAEVDLGPYIAQADDVPWFAANNRPILWSGV